MEPLEVASCSGAHRERIRSRRRTTEPKLKSTACLGRRDVASHHGCVGPLSQPARESPGSYRHREQEKRYRRCSDQQDPVVGRREKPGKAPCWHLRGQCGTGRCLSSTLRDDPTSRTLSPKNVKIGQPGNRSRRERR